jgi:branched-chain amino acid transport system ATP-binding protein
MMLVLDKVSAIYGKIEVINEITMKAQAAEIITILGLNGAGKSASYRTILGLIMYRAGNKMRRLGYNKH